jgi:hypothetical protein
MGGFEKLGERESEPVSFDPEAGTTGNLMLVFLFRGRGVSTGLSLLGAIRCSK